MTLHDAASTNDARHARAAERQRARLRRRPRASLTVGEATLLPPIRPRPRKPPQARQAPRAPSDATLRPPTRPRLADFVPAGLKSEPTGGRRAGGAFPASLSRTWGEASWTGHDLWVNSPRLAAARASAALSTITPLVDLEARKRTYRRLRQAVEERRAPGGIDEETDAQMGEVPLPTSAMLALGAKAATWAVTVVMLALASIVVLLGVEFGIVDVVPR
jgi:hypothetical protein